jgi:hypothetical protein
MGTASPPAEYRRGASGGKLSNVVNTDASLCEA